MAQASNADMGENGGRTTISVSEELADELYNQKDRTQSYEDLIWELLGEDDDE